MVATYSVVFLNGASLTENVITNGRFRTDDANTADLSNPCLVDNVLRRSYWKGFALKFGGTFSQITNIRIYSNGDIDWNLGTLGKLKLGNRDSGDIGVPDGSYVQASGTPAVTGNNFESSHSYFSGQTTKYVVLNSITSSGPKVVDSSTYTSAGRSKHAVLQLDIDTDSAWGVLTAKTVTFLVDEI